MAKNTKFTGDATALNRTIDGLIGKLNLIVKAENDIAAAAKSMATSNKALATSLTKSGTAVTNNLKATKEHLKTIGQLAKRVESASGAVTKYKTVLGEQAAASRAAATASSRQATFTETLNSALKKAAKSIRQLKFQPAQLRSYQEQLDKMKKRLDKATTSIGKLKTQTRQADRAIASSAKQIERLKNASQRYSQQQTKTNRTVKDGTRNVREMNLSWKSFTRLIAVQAAHQAFSAFLSLLKEGVVLSIELQKALAEVQTITQTDFGTETIGAWLEVSREQSSKWGLDILGEVESAYQSVSNQIIKTTSEFAHFGDIADQFAVTARTTADNSVNLLTAAINAFQLDVRDTEQVAAQFFKTIELGRVRAEEMANSFGDIAVLANQLNIELAELQAAITVLTIQGIKWNKTSTQIRGILIKLIKPTGEMKELLDSLGAASGEAAIELFGLGGFLAILEKRTRGSSTELAKQINRVRGLSGAMALQGKFLGRFNENYRKITESLASFGKATELVMASTGKKLEIELTRVRNFLKVEVGNSILNTLGNISNGFSGLEEIVRGFAYALEVALVPAITLAILGLGKLSKAMFLFAAANAPAAIAIAVIAGIAIGLNHLINSAKNARSELEATAASQLKIAREAAQKEHDMMRKREVDALRTDKERLRSFNLTVFEMTETLRDAGRESQDIETSILASLEESTKKTTEALRKNIEEIKEELSTLEGVLKDATDFAGGRKDDDATIFGWNQEGLSVLEQARNITQRIADLHEKIAKASQETDPKRLAEATKTIREAFAEQRELVILRRDLIAQERKQKNLESITNYKQRIKNAEDRREEAITALERVEGERKQALLAGKVKDAAILKQEAAALQQSVNRAIANVADIKHRGRLDLTTGLPDTSGAGQDLRDLRANSEAALAPLQKLTKEEIAKQEKRVELAKELDELLKEPAKAFEFQLEKTREIEKVEQRRFELEQKMAKAVSEGSIADIAKISADLLSNTKERAAIEQTQLIDAVNTQLSNMVKLVNKADELGFKLENRADIEERYINLVEQGEIKLTALKIKGLRDVENEVRRIRENSVKGLKNEADARRDVLIRNQEVLAKLGVEVGSAQSVRTFAESIFANLIPGVTKNIPHLGTIPTELGAKEFFPIWVEFSKELKRQNDARAKGVIPTTGQTQSLINLFDKAILFFTKETLAFGSDPAAAEALLLAGRENLVAMLAEGGELKITKDLEKINTAHKTATELTTVAVDKTTDEIKKLYKLLDKRLGDRLPDPKTPVSFGPNRQTPSGEGATKAFNNVNVTVNEASTPQATADAVYAKILRGRARGVLA